VKGFISRFGWSVLGAAMLLQAGCACLRPPDEFDRLQAALEEQRKQKELESKPQYVWLECVVPCLQFLEFLNRR
jgi:hypothetical protein